MPDPDDILWPQSEIPEPEAPQLPPENAAPTEDVLGIPDMMADLGDVARAEVAPPQPEIADADVPAFPQASTEPPQAPQQRVQEQAWQRGAERKARLNQPIPPPPDWNRVAADNEAFADLGQVARAEAQDVDAGPVPEGATPGMGAEFHQQTFGDQGFGTIQMEQEGQQRDVASQAFSANLKHSILLTEMAKEYARRMDELSVGLERDRL